MNPVRYAVVGLGHIAQVAVLPAFAHAKNSKLTALVSGDAKKLEEVSAKYGVENRFAYEDYDDMLASGIVDAVYIALPNSLHFDYARRALERGVHVLCEKPLTADAAQAEALARAAAKSKARLMTAYRLHFERANLEAVELVKSGVIGEPRFFTSSFSMQLTPGNIRADRELGGGPLWDLGIYCINAARYFFRAEPEEASAFSERGRDARFKEVDEMTTAMLRFPGGRLAQFTCSFGAADTAWCEVVGTKGEVCLTNAYEYTEEIELESTVDGRSQTRTFAKRDQFAPELVHFSECVQAGKNPEPDAAEGAADVRIIEALLRSARTGRSVDLRLPARGRRPSLRQQIRRRPVRKPEVVKARAAHRG
ncbi:MAG: Gfo/Idh/MocA family oxidoreductase [Elusimicrobiota bacterium]|nr:MAG: Gfo/Idh/MocA family oxidoreductase [Elusimicrobiota bacterium]